MRAYGKIESGFWQNQKVRPLGRDAKLLLLYLYSCPHGNSVGCFILPAGYIIADLDMPAERVSELVSELVSKGFIERDEASGLTRIVGWFGHNTIENGNVAKAAMRAVEQLPDCVPKTNLLKDLNSFGNKFINPLLNGLANALANEFRNPEPSLARAEPEPEPSPGVRPKLGAPAEAIRIRQAVVALFGDSEVTLGWHWSEISTLIDAGYAEAEIMTAADRAKARGVVPKKLANYLRPGMDELRTQSKAAPPKSKRDFTKY